MANFADTDAGRATAEIWAKAKIVDKTWVVAHVAADASGHTIVRFQRFMSSTHPDYGAWVTSRADDAT